MTAIPVEGQTASQSVMDVEREYLLQNYSRYPLVLRRGKGAYVYDLDGKMPFNAMQ
jgi:acetylornithine aminotransferase/acetylornithine/N-succinyldiaminopimelate aminotransferase